MRGVVSIATTILLRLLCDNLDTRIMRLLTLLKTGKVKLCAIAIVVVASSLFAVTTGPFVKEANAAVTPGQCYNFNGNTYNPNGTSPTQQSQKECVELGYCRTAPNSKIECSAEIFQEHQNNAANNTAILNAQVAPLIDIICANANSPAGKSECVAAIKAQYPICANGAEEGSPTEDQINSAIANCMRNWAKTAYPNTNVDLAKLTAAVAKGRSDGSDEAKKIGTEKDKKDCETRGGTWADGKCAEKEAVLCSGGALGWIMCPLAELASNITTELAKFISGVMTFSPLLNSEQGKAIQTVWQLIVNIANVLLVIAFLFVVFSQATSVGLSNYGIKKMLPKIIAAAILMNLSFFICAVGVDIANVLGQSVAGIIQVGMDALPPPPSGVYDGDIKGGSDGGDIAMFTLISGLGLAGLIVTGNIFLVLPMLATAAVAMFTAFAVIMFRQIALVIMIILSPLAFVAWVLPNTESWFEKWRKFFIALLLMFPLIMTIFYGATFLSRIILITLDPTKGWADVNMVKIMALAVLVLPLFAMPFIMKMAGGVLERFGAWTNDRNKGLIDRTRNKANEWRGNTAYQRGKEDRKNARNARRQARYANDIDNGTGLRGRYRRAMAGGIPMSPGALQDRREALRLASEQKRADFGSRVKRRNEELGATDFYSHGTKVYTAADAAKYSSEELKAGKAKDGSEIASMAMHERLAAMASDENLVYYDGHGRRREIDTKKDQFYKYAAMHRIGETGDKKATAAAYMNNRIIEQMEESGASVREIQRAIERDLGGDGSLYKQKGDGSKVFKYTVTNTGDKAELMQELNSSQGLAASHPHFRMSEPGAFNNLNAAKAAAYSRDEAVYAFNWHDQQLATARASGDAKRISAAQTARDRMVTSFIEALKNPNYQGTMDAGAIEIFENRTTMSASAIRSGAGTTQQTASVNLQPGQTMSQGGIIIPQGVNVTPPNTGATPPPPSTPSATQQQRQNGGNFGGFNPPNNQPPTPPNNP